MALAPGRNPWKVGFASNVRRPQLCYLGVHRKPKANGLRDDHCLVIQCVQEGLPLRRVYLLEQAATTMQITVYLYGQRRGQELTAHIRRPNTASKRLRVVFLLLAMRASCSLSFCSLGSRRQTVSSVKLKVHPHHLAECPVCAFFHETGALSTLSKATAVHVPAHTTS